MTADSSHPLDDPSIYDRHDPNGMGAAIIGLPDQVRAAWTTGRAWTPPASFVTPTRVVIIGMGGSAIGADIASTLARLTSPIAVEVIRDYTAPPIAPGTLVIASSVSGNTEETLAAYEVARAGDGMHMAITTGGKLAAIDAPLLRYDWGFHPRAALGWGLMPLAAVLTRLGVLAISDDEVRATTAALDAINAAVGRDVPTTSNRAKQIALRLQGRMPVIVGSSLLEVAARRWAGQVQENAKQWGFSAALPEFNHNFLNGLGLPSPGLEQLHVLFLDSTVIHPRVRRRIELTLQPLEQARVAHSTELIEGDSPLHTLLGGCYLGDWVSYYLAMLNGADPADTSPIESFKQRMG
ncbi:MAG: bifunctional phosphoglucose/phosphomannose isomerase [Chloroflexi bacterium]|nr:bifunctional phosphoglucose/phosphomannose isomerase [Chloroflexota bacterium]MDA1145464.1 bifunctional phosphoglucose/phosphomannose isomerase [Chloroflexota bacterium]